MWGGSGLVRRDAIITKSYTGSYIGQGLPLERVIHDLKFIVRTSPLFLLTTDDDALKEWFSDAQQESQAWVDSSEIVKKLVGEYVKEHQGEGSKLVLGTYYALLMRFWLECCPCMQLEGFKSGVKVVDRSTTLGSLKFLWKSSNRIMHLECSVKFFCWTENSLVGPHLSETLDTRYRYALRKMAVAEAAKDFLDREYGVDSVLASINIIQGYVFYPLLQNTFVNHKHQNTFVNHKHLIEGHCRGWYSSDFSAACSVYGNDGYDERWVILPKLLWMAPLEIPVELLPSYDIVMMSTNDMMELLENHLSSNVMGSAPPRKSKRHKQASLLHQGCAPLLLAQLLLVEGVWTERTRGFMLSPKWNPSVLIQQVAQGVEPNKPNDLSFEIEQVECLAEGEKYPYEYTQPKTGVKSFNFRPELVRTFGEVEFMIWFVDKIKNSLEDQVNKHGKFNLQKNKITTSIIMHMATLLQERIDTTQLGSFFLEAVRLIAWEHENNCKVIVRILASCCEYKIDAELLQLTDAQVLDSFLLFCIDSSSLSLMHFVLSNWFQGKTKITMKCKNELVIGFAGDFLENIFSNLPMDDLDSACTLVVCFIQFGAATAELDQLSQLVSSLVSLQRFDLCDLIVSIDPCLAENYFYTLTCTAKNFRRSLGASMKIWGSHSREKVMPPCGILPWVEDHWIFDTVDGFNANPNVQLWFIDSCESLLKCLAYMKEFNKNGLNMKLGMDAEWGDENCSGYLVQPLLSLWQLALNQNLSVVIDILFFIKSLRGMDVLYEFMMFVFNCENFVLVGYSVSEDMARLHRMFEGRLPRIGVIDVQCALAVYACNVIDMGDRDPYSTGLQYFVKHLLGINVSKEYQCSEWTRRPLLYEQFRYAGIDAILPLLLLKKIHQDVNLEKTCRYY